MGLLNVDRGKPGNGKCEWYKHEDEPLAPDYTAPPASRAIVVWSKSA